MKAGNVQTEQNQCETLYCRPLWRIVFRTRELETSQCEMRVIEREERRQIEFETSKCLSQFWNTSNIDNSELWNVPVVYKDVMQVVNPKIRRRRFGEYMCGRHGDFDPGSTVQRTVQYSTIGTVY